MVEGEEQHPGHNRPCEPVEEEVEVEEEELLEQAQKGGDAVGVDVGASSAVPVGAADVEEVVEAADLGAWDTYMPVSVPQDRSLRIHIGAPLEDGTLAERVVVGGRIDTG